MKIPFMTLARQFAALKPEIMAACESVFSHGRVLSGPEVAAFETNLAGFFGLPHAVAVGSGTDALVLALKALGIGAGDRVAVTSLSFVASASAIRLAGATPVFVDVEPIYGQAQEAALLELINDGRVQAVIIVHIFGQMMDLSRIRPAALARGVRIVEDAAQALGSTRFGVAPGHNSDATCVSFDPMKVIGAYGSGGAVLTSDPALRERLARLRYHGHAGGRVYTEIGHNSQLPTVQAAMLDIKMRQEPAWKQRRQAIAARYDAALNARGDIRPPAVQEGNVHNYHKYVMTVGPRRDELAVWLKERGIDTTVHYKYPLHTQPCFEGQSETCGAMPVVTALVKDVLSLPMFPELTDAEVDYVCQALEDFPA